MLQISGNVEVGLVNSGVASKGLWGLKTLPSITQPAHNTSDGNIFCNHISCLGSGSCSTKT